MSVSKIKANTYKICCIKPKGTKCKAPKPWFVSCSKLFPNQAVQIMFVLIVAGIILTNIISCSINVLEIFQHYLQGRKVNKTTGPYNFIICWLNVSYLMCGIYLGIILRSDFYCGKKIMVRDYEWK